MSPPALLALGATETLTNQLLDIGLRAGLVLLVLLGGLIAAHLARRATRWFVRRSGLETLLERIEVARLLYAMGIQSGIAHVIGNLIWFLGVLLTLASILELLGLPGIASGVSGVVEFFPRIIAALAVLVSGLVLADVVRKITRRLSSRRQDIHSPEIVSQLIYYLIVTITCTLAAEQVGIQTGLINALIQIGVAVIFASLGLSFALGSRQVFQNLLARFYLERIFRRGDGLDLDGERGVVINYSAVAVIVRFPSGDRVIPCQSLLERTVGLDRVDTASQPSVDPVPDPASSATETPPSFT